MTFIPLDIHSVRLSQIDGFWIVTRLGVRPMVFSTKFYAERHIASLGSDVNIIRSY